MTWPRDTNWRQGSILPKEFFSDVSIPPDVGFTYALAISHDCDIANDDMMSEPCVEFILCKTIDETNGQYAFGKNPRSLHLPANHNDELVHLELIAANKIKISKSDLAKHDPDNTFIINQRELAILQGWLAARYNRQALPDSLVNRLKPVFNHLTKTGGKFSSEIIGYWIDYSPRNEELSCEDPYELWIYVVYSIDDPIAEKHAQEITCELEEKFAGLTKKTVEYGHVGLTDCVAYSEEEFTLRDMRKNIKFMLDYLSHRTAPTGPIV